jgi:hypothetical protein
MSATLDRDAIIKYLKQLPRWEQLDIIADVLKEMAQELKAQEEQNTVLKTNPDEESPDIRSA